MTNSRRNFNKITKGKTPPPFSLRLTFEERAKLEEAANGVPLSAYVKAVLFGQELEKVRRRNTRPVDDHIALARVLAALGQSRLSSNLNQLARAVNTGTLPVPPDIEAEIRAACQEIVEMRSELLRGFAVIAQAPMVIQDCGQDWTPRIDIEVTNGQLTPGRTAHPPSSSALSYCATGHGAGRKDI